VRGSNSGRIKRFFSFSKTLNRVLEPTKPIHLVLLFFHAKSHGGAVGWGTALQPGRSRIRFPIVSLDSFRPHCGPGVGSASNRNEYQEYFLGGKGGRCVGLTTLPPLCADCLEIWEPQPPGSLRFCPGLLRDWFTCSFHADRATDAWSWHSASSVAQVRNYMRHTFTPPTCFHDMS